MHIYSRDQQAFHLRRTDGEKWFSRLNTLVVGMNLVCFLAAIIQMGSAGSDSMTNSFFSYSTLQLGPQYLVPLCNYTVHESRSVFQDLTYNFTSDNIGYFVSRHVQQVRFLLAIAGVHAAVSIANRSCFEFNIHELRYNFVVFKKDMLTMWEVLLLCIGAVVVMDINKQNTNILNYLLYCNNQRAVKVYNNKIPCIELQISFFSSIAILGFNAMVAAYNMLSKPNPLKELVKRDRSRQEALFRQAAEQESPGVMDDEEEDDDDEEEEEEEEEEDEEAAVGTTFRGSPVQALAPLLPVSAHAESGVPTRRQGSSSSVSTAQTVLHGGAGAPPASLHHTHGTPTKVTSGPFAPTPTVAGGGAEGGLFFSPASHASGGLSGASVSATSLPVVPPPTSTATATTTVAAAAAAAAAPPLSAMEVVDDGVDEEDNQLLERLARQRRNAASTSQRRAGAFVSASSSAAVSPPPPSSPPPPPSSPPQSNGEAPQRGMQTDYSQEYPYDGMRRRRHSSDHALLPPPLLFETSTSIIEDEDAAGQWRHHHHHHHWQPQQSPSTHAGASGVKGRPAPHAGSKSTPSSNSLHYEAVDERLDLPSVSSASAVIHGGPDSPVYNSGPPVMNPAAYFRKKARAQERPSQDIDLSTEDTDVLDLIKMVAAKKLQYFRPHAVDATIQHEKSYQRQNAVNENSHKPSKRNLNASGRIRYSKKVGLGFKTPKTAANGKYIDKKCPFTSDVVIRGRILRGIVHSTKMNRTIVIRRNYLHFIKKYQRYQKRHRSLAVHCSPAFEPKKGDEVIVGQCRPLSKTVRYNVLEVVSKSAADRMGKKFAKA